MALVFRLATNADAPAIVALVQANDADLLTDYGSYVHNTAADIRAMVLSGDAEVIIGDNNGVILGASLFIRHKGFPFADLGILESWECLLTVTSPTLTAAQRLSGFGQMLIFIKQKGPATVVWGRVKAGRRLDLALSTIPSNTRIDTGDGLAVHYGPVGPLTAGDF